MFATDPTTSLSQITTKIDGPKYQKENKGKGPDFYQSQAALERSFLSLDQGRRKQVRRLVIKIPITKAEQWELLCPLRFYIL